MKIISVYCVARWLGVFSIELLYFYYIMLCNISCIYLGMGVERVLDLEGLLCFKIGVRYNSRDLENMHRLVMSFP